MKIGDRVQCVIDPKQLAKLHVDPAAGEIIDNGGLTTEEKLVCVRASILEYLKKNPASPIDLVALTNECCPLGWEPQIVVDTLAQLYEDE